MPPAADGSIGTIELGVVCRGVSRVVPAGDGLTGYGRSPVGAAAGTSDSESGQLQHAVEVRGHAAS